MLPAHEAVGCRVARHTITHHVMPPDLVTHVTCFYTTQFARCWAGYKEIYVSFVLTELVCTMLYCTALRCTAPH